MRLSKALLRDFQDVLENLPTSTVPRQRTIKRLRKEYGILEQEIEDAGGSFVRQEVGVWQSQDGKTVAPEANTILERLRNQAADVLPADPGVGQEAKGVSPG